MPQSHKDTKFHKVLNINSILLVKLGVFVTLWQKKDFSEWTQIYCIFVGFNYNFFYI